MANPIFNALMGTAMQGIASGMNPAQILASLKSNPMQILQQAGFNVPPGMNNPQQIINHLMQSGQMNQNQLQQAQQMARNYKF